MPLKTINWPTAAYNSDRYNLLDEIVVPMLAEGSSYDRSVGYLESSHLVDAAQGLFEFCERGGVARFLIGSPLSKQEIEAYQAARAHHADQGDTYLEHLRIMLREKISQERPATIYLAVLQYLISSKKLDIRLVLRERGMYHPKIRISKDISGDCVISVGSDNDSYNALSGNNRESGTLFFSWKYPSTDYWDEHGVPWINDFEMEWDDKNPASISVPLSEQAMLGIKSDWEERGLSFSQLAEYVRRLRDKVEDDRELRPHQEQALDRWEEANFRGILAHCTGAGKTFTALYSASLLIDEFRERDETFFVVVTVPFQILAEQWCKEIEGLGHKVVRCWSENPKWEEQTYQALSIGIAKISGATQTFFVVVNETFVSDRFQEILKKMPRERLFFVADEVHRHGSNRFVGKIPNADYLLGLSATPWASHEGEREQLLRAFYGDVIHEYGLAEALEDEVLCPYTYSIVVVHLDEEEADYYASETRLIAEILGAGVENLSHNQRLELSKLYRIRSGILGTCSEKFDWLERETKGYVTPRTLFYCSDGRSSDPGEQITSADQKSILRVGAILDRNGWKVAKITAQETPVQRYKNLEYFGEKARDCLLAIRVLDEGFNLPSCERAYLLASSRNERQFIQRRGRVLRQSPETGKTHAEIVDFLVLPPKEASDASWVPAMVEGELLRAFEFARFSMNSGEVIEILEKISESHGLSFTEVQHKVNSRRYSDEELEVE